MTRLKTRTVFGSLTMRLRPVPNSSQVRLETAPKSREDRGDEQRVEREARDRGVGGDGADRHDPALGVDPLERGRLKEGQRPPASLARASHRAVAIRQAR